MASTYMENLGASLQLSRVMGAEFEEAWRAALVALGPSPDKDPVQWAKPHLRAAYNGEPSPRGRFGCPEPEAGGTGTRRPVASEPREATQPCRSGDGCFAEATCGRWEPKWCERHGAELERLDIGGGKKAPGPWAFPSAVVSRAA
jgi:hypothetical protein